MITPEEYAKAIAYVVDNPALQPSTPVPDEPRFAVRLSMQYEVFDKTDGHTLATYETRQNAIDFCNRVNDAAMATRKGRWDK